jgi:hypothetical protein
MAATVSRLTPLPATVRPTEIAEHFDAGLRVLDVLSAVDGSLELLSLIKRVGPEQQQEAVFSASILLRLHELGRDLQLPTVGS